MFNMYPAVRDLYTTEVCFKEDRDPSQKPNKNKNKTLKISVKVKAQA